MSHFDYSITAEPASFRERLTEIVSHKELLWMLALRDTLVRFKQTYAGLAWLVLKPFLLLLALTFLFGRVTRFDANAAEPYALVVLAGLIPWQFLAASLTDITGSLNANRGIITKVYFPRILIPAASLFTAVADLIVALVLLVGLYAWYGYMPGWHLLALPFLLLLLFTFSMGIGIWMCALNAQYRDVQYLLPFVLQLGMYLSPVAYKSSQVPDEWLWLYHLNPAAGIIEGFRWCLLNGTSGFQWKVLAVSTLVSVVLLLSGLRYFYRVEKKLVDVL